MSNVHTPFFEIEHDNLGATVSGLEALTSLDYGELHPTDLPDNVEFIEKKICHICGDSHPHLYELLRADLLRKLHSLSHDDARTKVLAASRCSAAEICVAIHIR